MLYPLTFEPILMERIWGGRNLERLYAKPLPAGVSIGESWEITDRPEGVSRITNGPFAGKDIRWLMNHHSHDLLGPAMPHGDRFPLLIKILDAREKLSLQVHPPASSPALMNGEPKTEMWFIADAAPRAELFVGLKADTSRQLFEEKINDGTVAECFHRIEVHKSDAMFLPSGRVHGIGAGNVIFEIQQNSDTTYRVFDWNRVDSKGVPRQLHVEESLQSILFDDFEPALIPPAWIDSSPGRIRPLARDPLFEVDLHDIPSGGCLPCRKKTMQILGVVEGSMTVAGGEIDVTLAPGQFCLKPASLSAVEYRATSPVTFLDIRAGTG